MNLDRMEQKNLSNYIRECEQIKAEKRLPCDEPDGMVVQWSEVIMVGASIFLVGYLAGVKQ